MSNADYSVQDAIANHRRGFAVPETATVVGTGGFGAWVAVFLARAGVKSLCLINPSGSIDGEEDVGGREIAIGPFYDNHLGAPKVDALEEIISLMRPDINLRTHKVRYEPSVTAHLLEGYVFAGVSNVKVLKGIFDDAAQRGLKCVAGSYFAANVGCYGEFPKALEIVQNAPVWVGSAAISALLAVNSAIVDKIVYVGDLSELSVDVTRFGPGEIGHDM